MTLRKPVKVVKRNDLESIRQIAATRAAGTTGGTKKGRMVETVTQWIDETRQGQLERQRRAKLQFGLP
jgi:hypothetical protein